MGGIYSPHTPLKGSRHIARREERKILAILASRDMAGAFSGGSGGIDTPRAPVTGVSVTPSHYTTFPPKVKALSAHPPKKCKGFMKRLDGGGRL